MQSCIFQVQLSAGFAGVRTVPVPVSVELSSWLEAGVWLVAHMEPWHAPAAPRGQAGDNAHFLYRSCPRPILLVSGGLGKPHWERFWHLLGTVACDTPFAFEVLDLRKLLTDRNRREQGTAMRAEVRQEILQQRLVPGIIEAVRRDAVRERFAFVCCEAGVHRAPTITEGAARKLREENETVHVAHLGLVARIAESRRVWRDVSFLGNDLLGVLSTVLRRLPRSEEELEAWHLEVCHCFMHVWCSRSSEDLKESPGAWAPRYLRAAWSPRRQDGRARAHTLAPRGTGSAQPLSCNVCAGDVVPSRREYCLLSGNDAICRDCEGAELEWRDVCHPFALGGSCFLRQLCPYIHVRADWPVRLRGGP